ncbi:Nitrogen fixation protein FixH [Enhydrobacter aerosaccus]|uniref:Nitrogen fixation protein FixH n=1 Tax=Enhydrobacter aerosaccus TaxID=225324 RepID=A0A1T4R0R3_9HYPH|nr:FixH family protein [Enhydrobacter aerosaccus]SKA09467.1 Nitrogen fixation protein FixH [Enhydrobacter aerosaccus]
MSVASTRSSAIPWIFVACFSVVFAVNGTMIWLAVSSFSGLYGNGARDREYHYNQVIAEQRERDALGWKINTSWRVDDNRLQIDITQADGSALPGATINAQLVRPAEKQQPVPLALVEVTDGRFSGHVDLPKRGNWDLDLLVVAKGHDFAITKRLFLK